MKQVKNFLLVLIAGCLSISMHAQWELIPSGTSATLYDVQFPSTSTGYIVGDSGIIMKTIDGGDSWTRSQIDPDYKYNAVSFLDANNGFIIGNKYGIHGGTLLHTTNGGDSWETVISAPNLMLQALYFLNDEIGFLGGRDSAQTIIWKTQDSGETWEETEIQGTSWLEVLDIHFPSPLIGYASLRRNVLKTIDGGNSWEPLFDPGTSPNSILESVFFIDENVGFIAGWYDSAFWKTEDGGQTWTDPTDFSFTPFVIESTSEAGFGFGSFPQYSYTTDEWNTWELIDLQLGLGNGILYGADFVTDDLGFAVGDQGTILKFGALPSSTSEIAATFHGRLFPNPSSGEVVWELPQSVKNGRVEIRNLESTVLHTIHFETESTIRLSNIQLPSGVYFLNLISSQGHNWKQRLIIHKAP